MQAVVEAARAVAQVMAAVRIDNNDRMQNAIPKVSRPNKQQPMFNWEAEEKYSKLKSFIWEINNTFESYNTLQTERMEIT